MQVTFTVCCSGTHRQTVTLHGTCRATVRQTVTCTCCGTYSQLRTMVVTGCSTHTLLGHHTRTTFIGGGPHGSQHSSWCLWRPHRRRRKPPPPWWPWPLSQSGTRRHSQCPMSTHLRTTVVTGLQVTTGF